jgi:hypothetical protein
MQIGEGVAIALAIDKPPAMGSLEVTVLERSSDEAVEGVSVTLSGPSGGNAKTDSSGKAQFSGLKPGTYKVAVEQEEFELHPKSVSVVVDPGASEKLEVSVKRIMLTLVLKRLHIENFWQGVRGNKDAVGYGHWWVEIEDVESYGWYPKGGASGVHVFLGVPGELNAVSAGPEYDGTPTTDPHGGDSADEMFHPVIVNGKPASAIKDCIRAFAKGYSGKWSWPWGQNCHSFQESMMKHCGLRKSGSLNAK